MKLSCKLKKNFLSETKCELNIHGMVTATLVGSATEVFDLPMQERYYVSLGDRVYSGVTMLFPEKENVFLTITKRNASFSLDVQGARLEVLMLDRLLGALCDEGKLLYLNAWEKTAFFGMLYLDLNQRDAILETPYLLEIKEALDVLGLPELSERLGRAIDACELDLPLDPMKKLTPQEETAMVESYHILWSLAENAPWDEEEHTRVRIYDFIYENTKN